MEKHICIIILENESEDDNIIQIITHCQNDLYEKILLNNRKVLHTHVRIKNYFEVIVPQYSLCDFHAHFRMKRTTMEQLANVIGQHMDRREYYIIPLQKQVALTVWILAKSESHLAVGDRFGMSASSSHYCFQNTIRTLASLIGTYIKWPNAASIEKIAHDFETRSRGISGVIGAIDGYHIPIMQPHNAVDYYNRKGFHSVILQGVCDNKKRFIDVHIGVPGRVHDARVFRNSPLFKNIMYHNLISPITHLIEDTAYPLSRFLLVPYKDNGHLTIEQIRYNQRLSSIRSIIERTFGLLKGKFRKLKYLEMYNLSLINYAIASACILHNFIIINEGEDDDFIFDDEIEDEENDIENVAIDDGDDNSGHDKRNAVVQALQ